MKAHRSNRSNRPVNRSEPVARENLNLFEFGFEFNRFPRCAAVSGRTPVVDVGSCLRRVWRGFGQNSCVGSGRGGNYTLYYSISDKRALSRAVWHHITARQGRKVNTYMKVSRT